MVQYMSDPSVPGFYNTVAAGSASFKLSAAGASATGTGTTGDYLDSFTVIAANTTPGAVTISDGANAVFTIPAGTATVLPYVSNVFVRAYSKTGAWTVTTSTAVSVVAIGKFT